MLEGFFVCPQFIIEVTPGYAEAFCGYLIYTKVYFIWKNKKSILNKL